MRIIIRSGLILFYFEYLEGIVIDKKNILAMSVTILVMSVTILVISLTVLVMSVTILVMSVTILAVSVTIRTLTLSHHCHFIVNIVKCRYYYSFCVCCYSHVEQKDLFLKSHEKHRDK